MREWDRLVGTMRVARSSRRKPPVWAPPISKEAKEIVAEYARLVESLPGVLGVWALWERGVLRIYTLIQPESVATENQIYKVESAIRDKWPDSPLGFYVSMDVEGFAEDMASVEEWLVPLH